jgi:hypothetical protein
MLKKIALLGFISGFAIYWYGRKTIVEAGAAPSASSRPATQ